MQTPFEKIIANNNLKTYLALIVYVCIFIFIGLLADIVRLDSASLESGLLDLLTFKQMPTITISLCLISFCIIFFSVGNFKRIMLSGNVYKEINPNLVLSRYESSAFNALQDLVKKGGLDFMPKLYIIEAPYMNAFASGWNEKNSMIALTSSILKRLEDDELKAVIAHELSHIRHGDVKLTMCVGILSNIMLLGVNIFAHFFSANSQNQGARSARGILFILQIILPIFTLVLSMFISRSREYMADSGAAYLMNDNEPMIRALQKISQDYEKNSYQDDNPTRASAYLFNTSEMLSTHPSIQNRINALLGR